jgi:hypothetical protein
MNSPHAIPEQQLNPPEPTAAQEREYFRRRNDKLGEITDAMRFNKKILFSDFDEESFEVADRVFAILNDSDGDKLGRINDVFDNRMESIAEWILDDRSRYSNDIRLKLGL